MFVRGEREYHKYFAKNTGNEKIDNLSLKGLSDEEVICFAKSMNINCSILDSDISDELKQFYINELRNRRNIGLYSEYSLDIKQVRRLSRYIYYSQLITDDVLEFSTPFGLHLFVSKLDKHKGLKKTLPKKYIKYLLDIDTDRALEIVIKKLDLIGRYLKEFRTLLKKDFIYMFLIDSIEHCYKIEKTWIDNGILNDTDNLERKIESTCSFLKPSTNGLKNTLELFYYLKDSCSPLSSDIDFLKSLYRCGDIPVRVKVLEDFFNNNNVFVIEDSDNDFIRELSRAGLIGDNPVEEFIKDGMIRAKELHK